MNVIVTGGSGFIGSHIVETYAEAGHEVLIVDLNPPIHTNVRGIAYKHLDLRKPEASKILAQLCSDYRIDVINHHAALTSVVDPLYDIINSNELGTASVIEACGAVSCKMIFASSAAVYGNQIGRCEEHSRLDPISAYGMSKMCGERLCRLLKEKAFILRYSNVYGPRQGSKSVIPLFLKAMAKKTPCEIFNPDAVRDFVHVYDVAHANLAALSIPPFGVQHTFNISSNTETTIVNLHRMLAENYGVEHEPVCSKPRECDIDFSVLDNRAASKFINWKPNISLRDGLRLFFLKDHTNTHLFQ